MTKVKLRDNCAKRKESNGELPSYLASFLGICDSPMGVCTRDWEEGNLVVDVEGYDADEEGMNESI